MIERQITQGRQKIALAMPARRWVDLKRAAKLSEIVTVRTDLGEMVLTREQVRKMLKQPGRRV